MRIILPPPSNLLSSIIYSFHIFPFEWIIMDEKMPRNRIQEYYIKELTVFYFCP